jgi:hypothetical protein
MIFSDLPSPAEASTQTTNRATGFAQAGNRYPLFGIMLLMAYYRDDDGVRGAALRNGSS